MTAERDIEKCYMAEFMTAHVGDTFQGSVTGVTKFGLFVGLPNGVEGLLPVTALPDDRYEYDEVRMTLTGARTKFTYSFGMPLEVLCAAANPGSGQIDFTLPDVVPAPKPVKSIKETALPPKGRGRKGRKPSSKPGYRPPKKGKGKKKR